MCYLEDMVSYNFCDVTGQNRKRLIEKLQGLKTPEFQNVFSSFLKTCHLDIISLILKLEKLAFYQVTSQSS